MKKIFRLMIFLLVIAVCQVLPAEAAQVTVSQGSFGQRVMEIQAMLKELHLYAGEVDGSYGVNTAQAVRAFQKRIRKPVTGTVSPLLYRIMANRSKLYFERFRHVRTIEATGYTSQDPGCGLYTYTGQRLRRGIIAVDPSVIPLGTRGYVVGYGPVLAADIGGAIRGNIIDLAFDTHHEAITFGRRMVKFYYM